MTPPWKLDAITLAAEIRQGKRCPIDIIESFLNRISARNDRTNAFVTVATEHARKQASEAAAAVNSGEELGPLHGVPIAIKDLTSTRGIRTTFGSQAYADHVPEIDATVVKRLRAAGAIVIGKTNTPEFGRLTVTRNPVFGETYNPWDTSKTPGGSSGGNAAALSDNLVPLALGSDAAGSIRIPSAACGTFGFVPDFGRIPFGPSQTDAFAPTQPFTFRGPMTRTPQDAALLLDVIAGPSPFDPFSLPKQEESYLEALTAELSSYDIAYSPDFGGCTIDPPMSEAIQNSVKTVADSGATVSAVDLLFNPPLWPDAHDALEISLQMRYVGRYRQLQDETGTDLLETDLEITPEVISRIKAGLELSPTEIKRADHIRTQTSSTIQLVFKDHDILVTPTLGRTAFDTDTQSPTINGQDVDRMHGWALTWPINLTGNPTASVPIGTVNGLPVGLQVIGPRHADKQTLAAAAAIDEVTPTPSLH